MADTDFTAEKLSHVQVVHQDQYNPYLLTPEQERKIVRKQASHSQHLTVPRRPKWDSQTTAQELDQLEKESFLQWRRGLAELQEDHEMLMTPFERNLEVWRQLWRVIERSDLIVQIVDARNPLLFRCVDLERYVQEVDPNKKNLLLVNKADMMSANQRAAWADYFEEQGVSYRFFSAHLAKESQDVQDQEEFADAEEDEEEEEEYEEEEEELAAEIEKLRVATEEKTAEEEDPRIHIITIDELEDIFLANAPPIPETEDGAAPTRPHKATIGLVGYPNVGKSSTINALMGAKKVSVSATPGKTKHFQTLHLSEKIILCDCPGLVFPNFASTKAELVCNGILPIDQQREFTGPATLVSTRIPQWFLEALYGIKIQMRPLEEGGTGIPNGTELLVAYARSRGYVKASAGNPDDSRAARYVLKDYINGKLCYCHAPPSDTPISGQDFNRELYDRDHLPESRRRHMPAIRELGEGEELDHEDLEMVAYATPQGRKTSAMDKQYFGRGEGPGGHLSNPFHKQKDGVMQAPVASSSTGRVLSGRKAITMVALENDLNPDQVAALKGSKKHFKGGKKTRAQPKKVEDTQIYS